MYMHRISKDELYLHGNYLKVIKSKNILLKTFEILNYKVLIISIERTCRMSFLINTCTILISDFMSFDCQLTPKDTVFLSVF